MEPLITSIVINRNSRVPLYLQVAHRIEEMVGAEELPPGAQLGDEVALADALGLSRVTVREAVRHLVGKGLLRLRDGGIEVTPAPRVRRQVALTSLHDDLQRTNRQPRTELLSFGVVPVPESAATALALPVDHPVIAIERLRYVADDPLAIMRNYLPVGIVEIAPESLSRHGLYQILRDAGVRPRVADQTIGACAASAAEARLLHEETGAVLLATSRTTSDYDGRIVEFGHHLYRASRYSFELRLVAP